MEHPYGYIKDNKVYLKGFLGQDDRVIGEVKEDEVSTLNYFEARFEQLKEKVEKLKSDIHENQNKGSFLMKLIHLKESLMKADALGDFIPLIEDLTKEEEFLNEIIQANRFVTNGSGLGFPRPANNKRKPVTAFVNLGLVSAVVVVKVDTMGFHLFEVA